MPKLRIPIGSDGPILDLSLWVVRAAAHAMIAAGGSLPPALTARALIDTGSDITAIHPLLLKAISPVPVENIEVHRPGMDGGFSTAALHNVRVAFAAPGPRVKWFEITAVGVVPASPGILALIGRDLLGHCRFLYDGFKAEILLDY